MTDLNLNLIKANLHLV